MSEREKGSETEAELQPIPDHIRERLAVLFVGYNPSIRSSQTGHHYANPSNRFWKMMHLSGVMPRLYASHEGAELLKLGFGFTNIVPRPTRAADEITREEYAQAVRCCSESWKRIVRRSYALSAKGCTSSFPETKDAGGGSSRMSMCPA